MRGMGLPGQGAAVAFVASLLLLAACKKEENAYVPLAAKPLAGNLPAAQYHSNALHRLHRQYRGGEPGQSRGPGRRLPHRDRLCGRQPRADKDKTLFVIEQPPYQAQLAEAQAKLKSLQANRAYAQAQLQRQMDLAPKGFSTQADLDQARAKRRCPGCRHPGCQGRDRHRHHQSRLHRGEGALRWGGHQPSPVGGRPESASPRRPSSPRSGSRSIRSG